MRIGSRQAPQTETPYIRQTATPAAFGAGVGTALTTLAGALTERADVNADIELRKRREAERLAKEAKDHSAAMRRANLEMEFIRTQGQTNRELIESRVMAPPGAEGYTDATYDALGQSFDTFAQRMELDEEERAEYATRFETFRQNATTSAFTFEFEESTKQLTAGVGDTVDAVLEEIRINPSLFDQRKEEIFGAIEEMPLPPTVKEELRRNANIAMATVALQTEMAAAMQDQLPAQEPKADDVVAPGASTAQRALATTTASVESSGFGNPYTVIYGGSHTDSFADHPRKYVTITSGPNKGKKSSAAGKYQFLASTWDANVREMKAQGYDFGPEEFSPVNQDRVFWHYAKKRYRNAARDMGMQGSAADLEAALMSGDATQLAQVRAILAGETGHGVVWEGLQHMSNEQFAESIRTGKVRGPLGRSNMPDVWSDPRFADLSFEEKSNLFAGVQEAEQTRLDQIALGMKEQEAALMAQLRDTASQGQSREAWLAGEAAIQQGRIRDIANIERIRTMGEGYRADYEATQEVQTRRTQGLPAQDSASLDAEVRTTQLAAGLREGSAEAAAVAFENFRTDALIPESITSILSTQLASGNPQLQTYAINLMAGMYAENPQGAMRGQSQEFARQMALATTLSRFSASEQEMLDRYNRMTDPNTEQLRKTRRTEAENLFQESAGTDILDKMYAGVWNRVAGVKPPSIGDMPQFESDARTLFSEFYSLFGDEAQARAATTETLKQSYTPSPFSGRLQQWSPTSPIIGLPTIEGTHDWVPQAAETFIADFVEGQETALREQAAAQGLDITDEAISRAIETQYQINDMELQADPLTLQQAQSGETPTYIITYTDGRGMPAYLYDENMQPVRMPVAPTPEMLRAQEVSATISHLRERDSQIDREISQIRREEEMQGSAIVDPDVLRGNAPRDLSVRREELEAARDSRSIGQVEEIVQDMTVGEMRQLRNTLRGSAFGGGTPMAPQQPDPFTAQILDLLNTRLREAAQ